MTAALALLLAAHAAGPGPLQIEIDGRAVLNERADAVGVWVNSLTDAPDPAFAAALRDLRFRSLRYGWQYGAFDPADPSALRQTPRDPATQAYFADAAGRLYERTGPDGFARLLRATDATGFVILSTDGANYRGTADAALAALPRETRADRLAAAAGAFAAWGRTRGVTHYEIGNENDLSGREPGAVIDPWTPAAYAALARRYVDAVKAADPAAAVGANGGLRGAEATAEWFAGLAAADPALANDLDFLVAHKYEFWLDRATWAAHPDWEFGRLGADFRAARDRHFPGLPVHVTEIGGWKTGEVDHHYRAVLTCEMLGNVRRDAAVGHVQLWPTRWAGEGGLFVGRTGADGLRLSPQGLGAAAYTRFARPALCAIGRAGPVRYFAARDRAGAGGLTVWLVNHGTEPADAAVSVSAVAGPADGTAGEVWRLESPSDDPHAADTRLRRDADVTAAFTGEGLRFAVTAGPTAVTAVSFGPPPAD